MDTKCPNCKGDAKRHSAGRDADRPGVAFIECSECGWFEVIPGVTPEYEPCEPQQSADDKGGTGVPDSPDPVPPVPEIMPSSVKPDGDGTAVPSPPVDSSDEEGMEVTFTDEIDY